MRNRSDGVETLTPLTRMAQTLYEGGVVPVREVARLCAVNQRTLYKYVHKYGWRRRYAVRGGKRAQAGAPLVAPASAAQPTQASRQPRGAGGRFVSRERAGLPAMHGLKALDAHAHARALARAIERRDAEADARMLSILVQALRGFTRRAAKPAQAQAQARDVDTLRAQLFQKIEAAAAGWQAKDGARPPRQPASEPETEQDRRINAIAAQYYARRNE